MNKQNKNGFTLIEILVVISIIGFIAANAMYAFNNARLKARDARRLSDIKQIEKALKLYYDDKGYYPYVLNQGYMQNSACTTASGIEDFSVFLSEYLVNPPDDPNNNGLGGCYWYAKKNDGQGYTLLMKPEDNNLIYQDMGCTDSALPDYYCIGENW